MIFFTICKNMILFNNFFHKLSIGAQTGSKPTTLLSEVEIPSTRPLVLSAVLRLMLVLYEVRLPIDLSVYYQLEAHTRFARLSSCQ